MRLHHLSVTAFGPFVDTAEVDLDTLSGAGLFLLSGATGAGKSSVLDAVCFALYGAVPGDRQHAGRLRSDQAPPGLAPSVTLEVTLSGRRFRVVRSPAWERPKKRGTGTTREQARVTVSEHVAREWIPLTSRLDEAGDLLSGLLGMNLDQFCQVALLPQGHFQAFLRADSAQRHQLLARLFRTGRFERVEAWLRDHRLALRRTSERHATVVGDLVSRLSEAAGRPVPDNATELAEDSLVEWARELRLEAATRRTTAAAEVQAATDDHRRQSTALAAARTLASDRARVVAAAETIERLDLEAEQYAADVDRLDRARRASGVRPLADLADERECAHTAAAERSADARATAVRAGGGVDDLSAELDRVSAELADLAALLPAERALDELRRQETAHVERLRAWQHDDELVTAETTSLTSLAADLDERFTAVDEAAALLPAAEADRARRAAVLAAHDDLARLTAEHAEVSVEHAAARESVIDLRQHLLDLREQRIAGMAAELAGGLVVGGDCPVCGSADHPHPARPTRPHPDADAERAAQRAVDDAQAVELAVRLRVRELDASLATARDAAGETGASAAQAAYIEAETARDDLKSVVASGHDLRARHAEVTERLGALAAGTAERRVAVAELTTTLRHVRAQAGELEQRVATARGEHSELRAAVTSLTARRDLVHTVRAAADAVDAARTSHQEAVRALGRAALEAGFPTVDEATAAQLPAEHLTELEHLVQRHRTTRAAARQVLDDPGAWELLTAPVPDLSALEAAEQAAAGVLDHARSAAETATRTDIRVRRLSGELDSALADWAPLRGELALATRMSSFVEGKAPDNRLQMRLSAYVLAHRLSQVVAAANARLARMSDQRYSLEHVGRRGAGESRGGLSLVVRDDWSGESRDPATLSGGETFVVSLALALGLADVVAHEAGGTDVQTLFVDEGFGALDAETLDDVLDILDTLRENGRAVGVVSHVAEMRDRIPTQLVVRKARTGSTLRVVG